MKAFDFNIEGLSLHEISFDDIPEKIRAIIDVKDPKGAFYDGIYTTHIVYDNLRGIQLRFSVWKPMSLSGRTDYSI